MRFGFGFASIRTSSDVSKNGIDNGIKCQTKISNSDASDSMHPEGGIFIRNEEECDGLVAKSIKTCLQPNSSLEIKKPAGKRFQQWLMDLYGSSPPKSGTAGIATAQRGTSSPSSSTTSDVECEPIHQRFSPLPTKSILKKRSLKLLPSCDLMMSDPVELDTVSSPPSPRKRLVFAERVLEVETYGRHEYNRRAIDYIARALTPAIAMLIKKELNEIKSEMDVHEQSKQHTQFYVVSG